MKKKYKITKKQLEFLILHKQKQLNGLAVPLFIIEEIRDLKNMLNKSKC